MATEPDDYWATSTERYHVGRAGEGAREKAQELGAGKPGWVRIAQRIAGVHTDELAWAKGAKGEEEVGRRLDQLPRPPWAVVHDLTIGSRGANLDHLVIGPAGVLTLNTKHLSGKVTLYDRALLVNGFKTDYLLKARREAEKVGDALSRAAGTPVVVRPVIVLMGCELERKGAPSDVAIVGRKQLTRWLLGLPPSGVTAEQVCQLERLARAASTWQQPKKPPQARPKSTSSTSTPPPPPPAAAAAPGVSPEPEGTPGGVARYLGIRTWKRYGHHRVYVFRLADDASIGYLDVPTGTVHVEDEADRGLVELRLRSPDVPRP